MKKEQARIAAELKSIDQQVAIASANYDAIRDRLDRCLNLLTNCHAAYLAAPHHLRRMMNQAVFEKFLVDMNGSSEAEPTDLFGLLLRTDFVLAANGTDAALVSGSPPLHRNIDWANGRPVNLGKVHGRGHVRGPERTGPRTRQRNPLGVGLNKHYLAEGVGFEPTVPCDTTVFETVRFVRSRIPPPERLAATPDTAGSRSVRPWAWWRGGARRLVRIGDRRAGFG